jgi:hypothetical protein
MDKMMHDAWNLYYTSDTAKAESLAQKEVDEVHKARVDARGAALLESALKSCPPRKKRGGQEMDEEDEDEESSSAEYGHGTYDDDFDGEHDEPAVDVDDETADETASTDLTGESDVTHTTTTTTTKKKKKKKKQAADAANDAGGSNLGSSMAGVMGLREHNKSTELSLLKERQDRLLDVEVQEREAKIRADNEERQAKIQADTEERQAKIEGDKLDREIRKQQMEQGAMMMKFMSEMVKSKTDK